MKISTRLKLKIDIQKKNAQTQDAEPMSFHLWYTVYNTGPIVEQNCASLVSAVSDVFPAFMRSQEVNETSQSATKTQLEEFSTIHLSLTCKILIKNLKKKMKLL